MSNSGSRNRRARQSRLRRRCPTLMKDEVTVCNALIEPSFTRCITHSREHGVLTRQYKEYAELASSLESQVLTSMSSATQSSELIRQKLVVAAQFITALSSEIKGREAHSKRFFGDNDAGHIARIVNQKNKLVRATTIQEDLKSMLRGLQQGSIRQEREHERDYRAPASRGSSSHQGPSHSVSSVSPRRDVLTVDGVIRLHSDLETTNGYTPHSHFIPEPSQSLKPPTIRTPLLPVTNADITTQHAGYGRGYSTIRTTRRHQQINIPINYCTHNSGIKSWFGSRARAIGVVLCTLMVVVSLYYLLKA
ncbi:hypothetical protein QCA50_010992 [Cerrena zonata]|uniref:Uncharacterized protein n=1 Tax=Cerrena zonata TaxID=2478898 RepID=A0AAW0FX72_9APHY